MKAVLFFLLLTATPIHAQDSLKFRPIDKIKVYEEVLKMGYESKQLYEVLIQEYTKRKDTLKVKYYRKKLTP